MGNIQTSIEERFWGKVNKTDTCWLWVGSEHSDYHYGIFWINQQPFRAHVYSWYLTHGNIPPNKDVLHKCNVRLCVNPEHLYIGTALDNARDRTRAGVITGNQGEARYNHKLTELQVKQIRRLYTSGITQEDIAKQYNVSRPLISMVCSHRIWRSVA